MRYQKGGIRLNPIDDGDILRQVLRSRFISHEQLWKISETASVRIPRSTFNWRLQRLVQHQLLKRERIPLFGCTIVYSIGRLGMEHLAIQGEYCAGIVSDLDSEANSDDGAVLHALRVNDIHLALKATGALTKWRWETQIRSQNELMSHTYAKDYDAIVGVVIDGHEIEFALEYERVAKASRRYSTIRRRIESERLVERFLYLASNYHLLNYLTQHFWRTTREMYFGLVEDFCEQSLDTKVLNSTRTRNVPLRVAFLDGRSVGAESTVAAFARS
jgi:hypothetical protein